MSQRWANTPLNCINLRLQTWTPHGEMGEEEEEEDDRPDLVFSSESLRDVNVSGKRVGSEVKSSQREKPEPETGFQVVVCAN